MKQVSDNFKLSDTCFIKIDNSNRVSVLVESENLDCPAFVLGYRQIHADKLKKFSNSNAEKADN